VAVIMHSQMHEISSPDNNAEIIPLTAT